MMQSLDTSEKALRFIQVDHLARLGASAITIQDLTEISKEYCLERIKMFGGRGVGKRRLRSPEIYFDELKKLIDGMLVINSYLALKYENFSLGEIVTKIYESYELIVDNPSLDINDVYELILLFQDEGITVKECKDCQCLFLSITTTDKCPTCRSIESYICQTEGCNNIIPPRDKNKDPRGRPDKHCKECKNKPNNKRNSKFPSSKVYKVNLANIDPF